MTTYTEWLSGRGFSQDTIRARERFYRARLREWGTLDQSPDTIATWLQQHTGWTRRTYHNHLTSIYKWMVEQQQLTQSPTALIKPNPQPRPKARPVPAGLRAQVWQTADRRTHAFLLLGSLAGLRAFEIAKFHGRDINESRIRVVGKGGVDEELPTHPALWQLARSYPRDGYWFPPHNDGAGHIAGKRVTRSVGSLFRRFGIEGAIHRARHSFATDLRSAGVDIKIIQELMRHKSLATTEFYLATDEDERRLSIGMLAA